MKFDGYDFSGLLTVEAIRRPFIPPLSANVEDVSGRDGGVLRSLVLGPLPIEVDVRLFAARPGAKEQMVKIEDLRRKATSRLLRREPCKLILHDAPDVYHMAILSDVTDLERFAYTGATTLYFTCPDPVGFGRTHTKKSSGGTIKCNVGGTYPTAPIVEVENADASTTVQFDGVDFVVDGYTPGPLVIDAEVHEARQGGTLAKVRITDDYPLWHPGVHTVTCSLPFQVRWCTRWL